MEKTIKQNGSNNGIILGVVLILIITVMYAVDLSLFTSFWAGIVNFIIIVSFGIYTSIVNKKLLKGVMTYKEAFLSFILPAIIGVGFYVLYTILLFNYIDPAAKDVITENVIEMTEGMMTKFNVPASEVEAAIEEIKNTDNFGPFAQFKSYFVMIVIYSIIGLLTSLIFKTPTSKE